jgi:hypothetical protein
MLVLLLSWSQVSNANAPAVVPAAFKQPRSRHLLETSSVPIADPLARLIFSALLDLGHGLTMSALFNQDL